MIYAFYGDIHAGLNDFEASIRGNEEADAHIQVGDFGFGFFNGRQTGHVLPRICEEYPSMRFIRGNHDDPQAAAAHPAFIKDGHCEVVDGVKIMYMGGAWSIDHAYRTPGVSWWHDEELSSQALNDVINTYEEFKPDIMVTHDCPQFFSTKYMIQSGLCLWGGKPVIHKTRTAQSLETMYEIHQPRLWLFGHWHNNLVTDVGNTTFACIGEHAAVNVDLTKLLNDDFVLPYPQFKWKETL